MGNTLQIFEELMGMTLRDYIINEIPSILTSLAVYVFVALALYTIAKRRGINHPWLAWIPFANAWLMGCISDQYRAVARGETKHRRRWLLVTEISTSVLAACVMLLCLSMLGNMFTVLQDTLGIRFSDLANLENLEHMDSVMSEADAMKLGEAIMGPAVGIVLLALVLASVAIINMVFGFIALHDIYKSCDPRNATLFLVLSILIGYAQPVCLFVCRNKDFGMPMRQASQPAYQPYRPIYGQPATPEEPWERKGP